MNKVRFLLGIIYLVGIFYGCHKAGSIPASRDDKGSVNVIMKASPKGSNADPIPVTVPGDPVSAKTTTLVHGPAFSHFNAVNVTISKVSLHSEAQGWIDLETRSGVYDLMPLIDGAGAVLVEKAIVNADVFDKVALTIGDANSIVIDSDHYALKSDASLDPRVGLSAEVIGGRNTEIILDFNAYNSVSCVDYGCFVLNPIVSVKAVSVN